MQTPPKITFRHLDASPALREQIQQRLDELENLDPRIISCDVVVDAPQKRRNAGRVYQVSVTTHISGSDIHISESLGRSHADEDIGLAVHGAFDATKRALKEQDRKRGGVNVKHHAEVVHGTIDRLFEGEGYGFIRAEGGQELYFDRDSLSKGAWEDLQVDMKVRCRENEGDKGPFATHVMSVA